MIAREKDLLLEGKNARHSSPKERLNAVFEVLQLAEELYQAARQEFSTNDS